MALRDPDMSANGIERTLERFGIEPNRLVIEVSERYVIRRHVQLKETLAVYRQMGIGIAIDDVGAGYSELERIANLEPNYIVWPQYSVGGLYSPQHFRK